MDFPLPRFSARLDDSWSLHESNLKSWLFVQGIALDSEQAAKIVPLSLSGLAATTFHQSIEEDAIERKNFDSAIDWCRKAWATEVRKGHAERIALNELRARRFKMSGKRQETVIDLVQDIELYVARVPQFSGDMHKKLFFVGAFNEIPSAYLQLVSAETYDQAICEAISWEADAIKEDHQARMLARITSLHRAEAIQRIEQESLEEGPESLSHRQALRSDSKRRGAQLGGTKSRSHLASCGHSHALDTTYEEEEEGEEEESSRHSEGSNSLDAATGSAPQRKEEEGFDQAISAQTCSHLDSLAACHTPELSHIDHISPSQSTPTPSPIPYQLSQFPRPPQSRPPLPSFDSPQYSPSLVPTQHQLPYLSTHRRSQSVDLDNRTRQERILTPTFISEATQPLFFNTPSRPSTTTPYSQQISPSPTTRSPSLLRRKNPPPKSRSSHSRSVSQPGIPSTPLDSDPPREVSNTLSRSRSLLTSLFRGRGQLRKQVSPSPLLENGEPVVVDWNRSNGEKSCQSLDLTPLSFVGNEKNDCSFESRKSHELGWPQDSLVGKPLKQRALGYDHSISRIDGVAL